MRLRVMSERGIDVFRAFLRDLRSKSGSGSTLDALREDTTLSAATEWHISPPPSQIASRAELAKYICDAFNRLGMPQLPAEPGLWTWMAAVLFEHIRPSASRRIPEDARYIYLNTFNRAYRHRVAGPAKILWQFRREPDACSLLLSGPAYELSDYEEQLASRQSRIQNKSLMIVANQLYFDQSTRAPKRGAQQRNRPGNLRRLVRVCEQFERTFDLYSMDQSELIALLPAEFSTWIPPRQ